MLPLVVWSEATGSLQRCRSTRRPATPTETVPLNEGVQLWEGMMRTAKKDAFERTGIEIEEGPPLWDWLVEYAAMILTRYKRRRGGKTAFQHIHGKEAQKAVCGFAENILLHPLEDRSR